MLRMLRLRMFFLIFSVAVLAACGTMTDREVLVYPDGSRVLLDMIQQYNALGSNTGVAIAKDCPKGGQCSSMRDINVSHTDNNQLGPATVDAIGKVGSSTAFGLSLKPPKNETRINASNRGAGNGSGNATQSQGQGQTAQGGAGGQGGHGGAGGNSSVGDVTSSSQSDAAAAALAISQQNAYAVSGTGGNRTPPPPDPHNEGGIDMGD